MPLSVPRPWVLMGSQPGSCDLQRQLSTSPSPNASIYPLPTHMSLTVEASQYPANTKNCCPQAEHRFSTDLHHSSLNSNYGADSRTTLPLSSLLVTTPYIDFLRPVCLSLTCLIMHTTSWLHSSEGTLTVPFIKAKRQS